MPHRDPFEAAVLEAEDLAGEVEHPLHHLLEGEEGGHLARVDAEALPADEGVQVAEVPRLHGDPTVGGGELGQFCLRLLGQGRDQAGVEGLDRRRRLGHLLLHAVVGPGGEAEEAGDLEAEADRLFQDGQVLLASLVEHLELQCPAQVGASGPGP